MKRELLAGLRRFSTLLLVAWVSFWLTLNEESGVNGSLILRTIDSFGQGLIVAGIVWLFCRWKSPKDFLFLSKPTCAVLLAVGILSFGLDYPPFRDSGLSSGEASLRALLGINGVLVGLGIAGLVFLSRQERTGTNNAPNQ